MEQDTKEIKKLKKIFNKQKNIIKKLDRIYSEVEYRFAEKTTEPSLGNKKKNEYRSELYKDVVLKFIDNFVKNEDEELDIFSNTKDVYVLSVGDNDPQNDLWGSPRQVGDEYANFSIHVDFNENIIFCDFGDGEVRVKSDVSKYKGKFEEIYCEREKEKLNVLVNKILSDTKLSRIKSLNDIL